MNAGILFQETCSDRSKQRRGRDSNPRYRFHGTHAFQAIPFDHSGTPPFFKQNRKIPVYKSTFNNNCRRSYLEIFFAILHTKHQICSKCFVKKPDSKSEQGYNVFTLNKKTFAQVDEAKMVSSLTSISFHGYLNT